jgi:S1-C subfamily serine protease
MENLRALLLYFVIAISCFFAGRYVAIGERDMQGLPQVGVGGGPDTSVANEDRVVSIVDQSQNSVVTIAWTAEVQDIRRGRRTIEGNIGSGFVLTENGYIVTNKHVVSLPADTYSVVLDADTQYEVEEIYKDPNSDVAILKISAEGLVPLRLGSADTLQLGENVIAIGTTLGEFSNSVTTGVISGLGRSIAAESVSGESYEKLENLIQTDAAINPGNSGGPLLNGRGEVIGMNTAVVGGAQNVGFAIPSDAIRDFAGTRDIRV